MEGFSHIAAVHHLPSGQLAVADNRDNRLVLLDLTTGVAREHGRRGAGPAEYRAIGGLVPRPGGGVYLIDFAARRLLPLAPDGGFENPIVLPVSMTVRGADAQGAIYGEAFLPRQGRTRADSMWILRWVPGSARVDTLMKYDASVTAAVGPSGGRRPVFPPMDSWIPLRFGEILVASAARYRLSVWRAGRPLRGFDIPWERRRISPAEREVFLESQGSQRPRMLGQPGASSSAPPAPQYEFPEFYPAFGGEGLGGEYLSLAGNGDLWIERAVIPGSAERYYDVVDLEQGTLLGQVVLPSRARLVGFGPDGLYLAEPDADDLEFIRRYPYPSLR